MLQIEIAPNPNQTFSVTLEGSVFDVTIKEANGVMVATVARDNVVLISNSRVLPFAPIIPYPYLEHGNLFVSTENEEIPYYTAFGNTQMLYYLSQDDMAEIRA